MTGVKLSDQLGAMAIVDELYQQQSIISEHLDQGMLRQKVAQKIKDYYESKNLPFDEDIINAGVKLWFERRLTFSVPQRSWVQRFLAHCYITRRYWLTALCAIFICAVILFLINERKLLSLQEEIEAQLQKTEQITKQLTDAKGQYTALSDQTLHYATLQAEKQKVVVSELLDKSSKELSTLEYQNSNSKTTPRSIKHKQIQKQQLAQDNTDLQSQVSVLIRHLSEWQELIRADKQFNDLITRESFIAAAKKYPRLQQAAEDTMLALTQGNAVDIQKVDNLYIYTLTADKFAEKELALIDALKALNLPEKDMELVWDIHNDIQNKLKNLEDVSDHVAILTYFVQLANTPLTLKIVDRVGHKSGIERTYDPSGGKTWYLIVEPVTPAGEVFPMWITSSETGKTKRVKMFGVRVKQQMFNQIRQDKSDDGHIDNTLVARKPVGRLLFTFEPADDFLNDLILEW